MIHKFSTANNLTLKILKVLCAAVLFKKELAELRQERKQDKKGERKQTRTNYMYVNCNIYLKQHLPTHSVATMFIDVMDWHRRSMLVVTPCGLHRFKVKRP